jgi:nucleoside-diphosphate-sugar epimerase
MSILIIGSEGLIGSLLVNKILEAGYKVKCLVRDFRKARGLKKLGVELVYGDLLIPSTLPISFKGVRLIIDSSVTDSLATLYESSYAIEEIEWRSRLTLLEIAKLIGVAKFIGFTALPRLPVPIFISRQLKRTSYLSGRVNFNQWLYDRSRIIRSSNRKSEYRVPKTFQDRAIIAGILAACGRRMNHQERTGKESENKKLSLSNIPFFRLPRSNPSWALQFKFISELEASGLNYTIVRFTGTFQRIIQEFLIPVLEGERIERNKIPFHKNYLDAGDLSSAVLKILQNPLYERKIISIEGDEFLTESQIIDFCERSTRQTANEYAPSKLFQTVRRKFVDFFEFAWTFRALNTKYLTKVQKRGSFVVPPDYQRTTRIRFRKSAWPFETRSFLACLKDYLIKLNIQIQGTNSKSINSDSDDVRFF